jgi:hypothetical protein
LVFRLVSIRTAQRRALSSNAVGACWFRPTALGKLVLRPSTTAWRGATSAGSCRRAGIDSVTGREQSRRLLEVRRNERLLAAEATGRRQRHAHGFPANNSSGAPGVTTARCARGSSDFVRVANYPKATNALLWRYGFSEARPTWASIAKN